MSYKKSLNNPRKKNEKLERSIDEEKIEEGEVRAKWNQKHGLKDKLLSLFGKNTKSFTFGHSISGREKKGIFGFWSKRTLEKKPHLALIVKMIFPNGTTKEWVIPAKKDSFKYQGKRYVIDTKHSFYNVNQSQFEAWYYFGSPFPIENVKTEGSNEAYLAINPDNAGPVIDQNYIKILATANEINRYMMGSLILSAINSAILIGMVIAISVLAKNITTLTKLIH